jgi:hypothetical protein
VYFSNRSNCHFELGDYSSSIKDAQTCLDLLNDNKSSTLPFKNLWRMARSKFFLGQDARYQASDVLMELVKCHDKTHAKTALRLLQQTRRSGSESFLIFLRSCPSDPAYARILHVCMVVMTPRVCSLQGIW